MKLASGEARKVTRAATSSGSQIRPSEFFAELRDALALAEATRDAAPVEACLREWRTTAAALADQARRAILTGPGDDDYAEVSRPQQ